MNDIQTIEEHLLIRETVGYDILKDIDVFDVPTILKFLKIVWNYEKMSEKLNEK